MGQRGRKSTAELSVAHQSSIERPKPPAWMSNDEKKEWREIVKCKPPEWMTRDKFPHLEAYCTHAVARRFAAMKYDQAMQMDAPDPSKVKKWSDIHSTESAKIQSLGIRLDIAQSTSYERNRRAAGKKKPWD